MAVRRSTCVVAERRPGPTALGRWVSGVVPDRRPGSGGAIEAGCTIETLSAIGSWRWDAARVRMADRAAAGEAGPTAGPTVSLGACADRLSARWDIRGAVAVDRRTEAAATCALPRRLAHRDVRRNRTLS